MSPLPALASEPGGGREEKDGSRQFPEWLDVYGQKSPLKEDALGLWGEKFV